ncbi:uncharacterized protein LOC27207456 [Drosophila simulans]|uniref:Uncharacterized protein LOC117148608 n=1 Tax=Drosophila mauritiana TaxID=7226 RepID=A0A6P8KPK5_DROMA|nr:uncharacterized protein LOC27207456 [Drosophila simulans]XP_033171980.1 uncharacterized protein LOC117148608 [Drosophila mauritiana]KMZ09866.1 uncharacterized protein Dsimw501_GD27607 [Drosophila simulans]
MRRQGVHWCCLVAIALAMAIRQVSLGFSANDRRFQCLQPRLRGQANCSPCADLYVFNRQAAYRRCEHVNGNCYPHRTVFASARMCELTCQPYIRRATLHEVTTLPPPPPIVEPFGDSDEEFE